MGIIGNYFYYSTNYWGGKIVERIDGTNYLVDYTDLATKQYTQSGICSRNNMKKFLFFKTKKEMFEKYMRDRKTDLYKLKIEVMEKEEKRLADIAALSELKSSNPNVLKISQLISKIAQLISEFIKRFK